VSDCVPGAPHGSATKCTDQAALIPFLGGVRFFYFTLTSFSAGAEVPLESAPCEKSEKFEMGEVWSNKIINSQKESATALRIESNSSEKISTSHRGRLLWE
jgi:hypothetical protein